jgi:hypothetical protein
MTDALHHCRLAVRVYCSSLPVTSLRGRRDLSCAIRTSQKFRSLQRVWSARWASALTAVAALHGSASRPPGTRAYRMYAAGALLTGGRLIDWLCLGAGYVLALGSATPVDWHAIFFSLRLHPFQKVVLDMLDQFRDVARIMLEVKRVPFLLAHTHQGGRWYASL